MQYSSLQALLDRSELAIELGAQLRLVIGSALITVARVRVGFLFGFHQLIGGRRVYVAVQIHRQALVVALDDLAIGGAGCRAASRRTGEQHASSPRLRSAMLTTTGDARPGLARLSL
jgi:hypothetical protein